MQIYHTLLFHKYACLGCKKHERQWAHYTTVVFYRIFLILNIYRRLYSIHEYA